MAFILTNERGKDFKDFDTSFKRYREYIELSKEAFPPGALELASSWWYFDFSNHRCPHDAWLEACTVSESVIDDSTGDRITSIRIRLLGAFHDGFIEFFYPQVFNYSLDSPRTAEGHGDWRYDEFRLSAEGHLIHEIEWIRSATEKGTRWTIEASDVQFQWFPDEPASTILLGTDS